jgi:Na+-transporting NADH:ubiquinone oxidoreductase subunit A
MIKIQKGLSIPLAGAPESDLDQSVTVRAVASLGGDYQGMKPTMAVQVGDVVKRGDLLFTDKKCEGVRYTSPAGGRVAAVNRGAKRAFESVVVEIDGDEAVSFERYSAEQARALTPDVIKAQLLESPIRKLPRQDFLSRRLIRSRTHRIPRSPLRETQRPLY